MKTVKMKLLEWQDHIGHCQLTYSTRNEDGQRLIYCLQDRGPRWKPQVTLLRCTQDGEPSHEVAFKQVRAEFERPTPGPYDSEYAQELKRLCNEWIDQYESEVSA
jgi:hypothetical protein